MNNEAVSECQESVGVLEWQNDSELKSISVGLVEDQVEISQGYPIMLFDSSSDVAVGPATTNSDRLI